MSGWRLATVNSLLPGAGLVIAGHLAAGLFLLVPAVLVLALLALALALFTVTAALPIAGILAIVYALLAAAAAGWWWRCARRRRFDPARVRALHLVAATAYLQNRSAEALAAARAVTAAAPEEAGAWRFLALVAADAGDPVTARAAERRAQHIDDR